MQDTPQVNSALHAVRCLYLARVAEREGCADAARRWRQMADGRLKHFESSTGHLFQSPSDASRAFAYHGPCSLRGPSGRR